MQADFSPDPFTPLLHPGHLGGVQYDILFSVMKVIHCQVQPRPVVPGQSGKVNPLSCCCRLSELMPLMRQLHDEARIRHEARRQGEQRQQAA